MLGYASHEFMCYLPKKGKNKKEKEKFCGHLTFANLVREIREEN